MLKKRNIRKLQPFLFDLGSLGIRHLPLLFGITVVTVMVIIKSFVAGLSICELRKTEIFSRIVRKQIVQVINQL